MVGVETNTSKIQFGTTDTVLYTILIVQKNWCHSLGIIFTVWVCVCDFILLYHSYKPIRLFDLSNPFYNYLYIVTNLQMSSLKPFCCYTSAIHFHCCTFWVSLQSRSCQLWELGTFVFLLITQNEKETSDDMAMVILDLQVYLTVNEDREKRWRIGVLIEVRKRVWPITCLQLVVVVTGLQDLT